MIRTTKTTTTTKTIIIIIKKIITTKNQIRIKLRVTVQFRGDGAKSFHQALRVESRS
jgi:hypothetical protein